MSLPNESARGAAAAGTGRYRVEEESIDASNAPFVRSALVQALYHYGPELTVDLVRVEFIDSTGLGMLLGVLREAQEMNGTLHLVNARRDVWRILDVTGLYTIFEEDEKEDRVGAGP